MGGDGVQMSRYFIEQSQINNDSISIIGEDYQHLKRVLRVTVGESINVCCEGYEYTANVSEITDSSIIAKVVNKASVTSEPGIEITLYQGLPKQDKLELIIQKCVEIGISKIVPVITRRCVSKINSDKDKKSKTDRWQKIAYEAAKQSNRGTVPKVLEPMVFETALKQATACELALIPYEKELDVSLKNVINDNRNVKSIAVFVGPEGGFEESEINLAESYGAKKVSLGPRILRTETAGMFVISILIYELGDK